MLKGITVDWTRIAEVVDGLLKPVKVLRIKAPKRL